MIETTTDKAEKTIAPKAKFPPAETNSKRDSIPINWFRLRSPVDLPGNAASDVVKADRQRTVELVPAVRAFRVTFTEQDKEPRVTYVPESNVLAWEGAP